MNKVPLLLSVISYAIYRLTWYLTDDAWLSLLIFLIPIGLLIINFLLRKRLTYSKWFLSPVNITLERTTHTTHSEISKDLLYDKLLEVIKDSQFNLLDKDNNESRILLGTSANFWTWGENIYIQLEPSSKGSVIHFTSVTLFGNTSWKRNDKNFDAFIHSFESSLTI